MQNIENDTLSNVEAFEVKSLVKNKVKNRNLQKNMAMKLACLCAGSKQKTKSPLKICDRGLSLYCFGL